MSKNDTATQKSRILVIDDEVDIRKVLEQRLSKAGYQVLTAATGREGIGFVFSENPDLILLDLMLPDMDGYGVCKILRQDPRSKTVPIIMLTAKAGNTDEVVGLEMGANDYLHKPYDFNLLSSRIRLLLDK